MRETLGLDKALQAIRGELSSNLVKLTEPDEHIGKEKRKLAQANDSDEFNGLRSQEEFWLKGPKKRLQRSQAILEAL